MEEEEEEEGKQPQADGPGQGPGEKSRPRRGYGPYGGDLSGVAARAQHDAAWWGLPSAGSIHRPAGEGPDGAWEGSPARRWRKGAGGAPVLPSKGGGGGRGALGSAGGTSHGVCRGGRRGRGQAGCCHPRPSRLGLEAPQHRPRVLPVQGDGKSLGVLVRNQCGVFPRGVSHPLGKDPEGPACLAAPPAAVGFHHHGEEGEALCRAEPRGVLVLPFELLVPLRRCA